MRTKGNLASVREKGTMTGALTTRTLKESAGYDHSHLGSQYLGGRGKRVTKSPRLAWATV